MIKYYKNFILCGEIDFFCLLCEKFFENVKDVERHIRWQNHRKVLKGLEYLPKFKKELVYKLDSIYYCEACNFVATKFNIIKTHLKEESHITNKRNPLTEIAIPQVERKSNYVKIGKSLITLNEWEGVISKECVVCHVAIKDVDDHVGSSGHIVNLIQAKFRFENEEHYYRELNNNTFYCFKCKKIYPNDLLTDHWSSLNHTGNKSNVGESDCKRIQYFDVDRENDVVTCRICNLTMPFTIQSVYGHSNLHGDTTDENEDELEVYKEAIRLLLLPDHGKLRHELKMFGKDNHIKLISGGAKGYCNICFIYISSHMRNFKQHVKGARHQGFLELRGLVEKTKKVEKNEYTTKPLLQYVKCFIHVKEISAIWLNKDICVSIFSFMFLCPLDHDKDKMRCFLCDCVVSSDMAAHFLLIHKHDYMNTQVITTFKDNFIREIRPNLYHCGTCNQIFPGFEILKKHFNSWKHKDSTMNAAHMLKYAISKYFNRPQEYSMNRIDVLD